MRSLYYDSLEYLAYQEKIDGSYGRIKLRLRTYSANPADNGPVRVELKTRRGNTMVKYSTFVTKEEYQVFVKTNHWPSTDNPVLSEYERLVLVRNQRPKLLVEYFREGYEPRDKSGYRVTFDHRVCSTAATDLFLDKPRWREHYPNYVVMEVKCRNQRPLWLANLMLQYGLKYVANSKYTQAVEIACHDVITPVWGYN